jgi:nucleoside-diphosphate-sugar epimerase
VKVVVTGATGHLGTYTVARLAALGHDVVAASRSGALPALPFGAAPQGGQVRAIAVDVTRDDAVGALAAELSPAAALVHLAAFHPEATAATGALERAALLETNVHGTMRALEAARRTQGGSAVMVYASTFEVYGEPEGTGPIDERARVAPLTDYGATKLAGEDHVISFAYEEKIRVIALRFPAIFGPGEHTPRALPNFLRAAANGARPTIHGDGGDLRDQIHARDAANAIALAIGGTAEGIYNVADGEPHSIAELASTALEVAGVEGQPEFSPRQKPRRDFHMNIAKARAELGFAPEIALRDGMAEQLAWLRTSPR